MDVREIINDLDIKIARYEPVHGGDINSSYCLHANDNRYFLKVNNAGRYPGMFEKEARGLAALNTALQKQNSIVIPGVLKHGIVNDQQYLLLQWMAPGSPQDDFWEVFGRGLATLHRQQYDFFGWHEDNYIGSLTQKNTKHNSWYKFFADCRVMPLVQLLYNNGSFSKQDTGDAEIFCKRSEQLFPGEPAALLHGDLWSGNFLITKNNKASVYDPAVYCGHREMDIGMTKLFGGFDERFYKAYNEEYPLEPRWQKRLAYSQLYPLLVHAVLFGGHYCSKARSILCQF
jgi:fructosamine-3-kinase